MQRSMNDIVKDLIQRIGVDSTEIHINMCIANRRGLEGIAGITRADMELTIMDYLASSLGHILTADDSIVIMNWAMVAEGVYYNLERKA